MIFPRLSDTIQIIARYVHMEDGMKKVFALWAALLLLLPFGAGAELQMETSSSYITFPELDGMSCFFRKSAEWTIVHRDNLDDHMALALQRGETEEAIRSRFQQDTLLWEAYADVLEKDACIRMECFENTETRQVWHLRHLSSKERKALLEQVNDGLLLYQYDTYSAKFEGSGGNQYITCGYTTVPPAAYESGMMYIRYINGRQYVMTYAVHGRMASRKKLRSNRENDRIGTFTPFHALKFGAELLPPMPELTLDGGFPLQVDVGDVSLSGSVTKGATLSVTLDGQEVPCKVNSKGGFTLTLPVASSGEHKAVLTVTHKKYTDRVEEYTFQASTELTPLHLTAYPELLAQAGEQTITGVSSPGADIVLRLDDHEAVSLTADTEGCFSHTFQVMDDKLHQLYVMAKAPDKDACVMEYAFATEYETFRDGLKAFEKKLTDLKISELEQQPYEHLGERVKISVKVQDVLYTEDGLGILCTYNPPKGSKHAKTPLYLTNYGYGQDQITAGMTITIYGVVNGQRQVEDETRLDILVQYGTYLVTR